MLKIIQRGQFQFSRRILRFHTLNKDSFSPFANIESFSVTGFVAKASKYTEHLLLVLIITLEVTVLKVIRIFLHQPVDNVINLVILNIIVARITCKTTVLVNFDKQKLSNSKTREKLTDKYSYLPSFAYHVQSSSLCRTVQIPTYFFRYYR